MEKVPKSGGFKLSQTFSPARDIINIYHSELHFSSLVLLSFLDWHQMFFCFLKFIFY